MKRLLALLLVCLLPLCALAEMDEDGNVIIDLGDAEVFFTPIDGYCLTRESSASVFNRLGMSQREMVPWMEEYSVYALMFDRAGALEVQVVISPTTELDFDDMTKYGLDMMCEAYENYYKSMDYDVESIELYHTFDGHSYVEVIASYTYEDGYEEYMVEYFTCQSGYAVSVYVFPYEGALTEDQMLQGQSVVESLWLSENPVEGQPVELPAEGISVRFYLPEGVTCLTKNSGEEEWYGLPKGLVSTRKKELARNMIHGMIVAPDGTWEITWCLFSSDAGGDMDLLSDAEADDFCQRMKDSYIETGTNVLDNVCEWIGPYRYVYIQHSYPDGGRMVRVHEYYTRQNGWSITIALVAYGEPAPEEVHAMLRDILKQQTITVYEEGAK